MKLPEWKPSEWFHGTRMAFWVVMVPVCFYLGWQASITVLFLYSTYANFASDLTALQAARSERHLGDA